MKRRAKHNRTYKNIDVGDEVRLLRKPEGNRASYRIGEDSWTRVAFKVLDKQTTQNGMAYTLENQQRAFLRHEIKLVTGDAEPSQDTQNAMIQRLQNTFSDARQAAPAPILRRLRKLRPDQLI